MRYLNLAREWDILTEARYIPSGKLYIEVFFL